MGNIVEPKYPFEEICEAYDALKGNAEEAYLDLRYDRDYLRGDRDYWAKLYINMREERDVYMLALEDYIVEHHNDVTLQRIRKQINDINS